MSMQANVMDDVAKAVLDPPSIDGEPSPEFPPHSDYVAWKTLPDGRFAAVCPLLLGQARVVVASGPSALEHEDEWQYTNHAGALAGLVAWDGNGEPSGWCRHATTMRRRPGGDPEKEYVGREEEEPPAPEQLEHARENPAAFEAIEQQGEL